MSCYLPLIEQNALLKEEVRILREELREAEEWKQTLIEELVDYIFTYPEGPHGRS